MGMQNNDHVRNQLMGLWTVQETLLQQYRLIFIATETILVSSASALFFQQEKWMIIPQVLAGFVVLLAWRIVCTHRGRCVSFIQWMILRAERDILAIPQNSVEGALLIDLSRPVSAFKDFQERYRYGRGEVNDVYTSTINSDNSSELFEKLYKSFTRKVFEVYALFFFGGIWILLFALRFTIKGFIKN